tara:strand:- start:4121 stop:4759 length:639 start_codon:yes stop_codon:yes gene_type:complete
MKKPRFMTKINTGERVHKPKRGKGSYDRKKNKMKKISTLLLLFSTLSLHAQTNVVDSQELKFLGKTIIYDNGSWVNPDEPKFKLKEPATWVKRNYVRHYMQGSEELTSSIIDVNWKGFKEAAITGNKIKMKDFIKVLRLKKTFQAVKTHPESALVPVGMAAGSALEGGEGTIVATIGLLKKTGEISLKVLKFVSTPVRKVLTKKQTMEVNTQ